MSVTDRQTDITGFINRAVPDLFLPNPSGDGFLMANLGGVRAGDGFSP